MPARLVLRKRMLRTVMLGLLALLAICAALYQWLDVSLYEVGLLLGAATAGVLLLAAAGALVGYLAFRIRNRNR